MVLSSEMGKSFKKIHGKKRSSGVDMTKRWLTSTRIDAEISLQRRVERRLEALSKGLYKSNDHISSPQLLILRDFNVEKISLLSIENLRMLWIDAIKSSAQVDESSNQKIIEIISAIETEWQERAYDFAFKWPSTFAIGGNGKIDVEKFPVFGVLSYLGYHVGKNSNIGLLVRRSILERIFFGKLLPVISAEYMASWGMPSSAPRLSKIAECLAAFARNAKRRKRANIHQAVADWESDLEYLYIKFYVGKFDFGWPKTS